jgi:DNA-binding HxlR family transcriptional regulator
MKGVGRKSLEKLRALEEAGGWLDSEAYFRRFPAKTNGNNLPTLIFKLKVVEVFVYFLKVEGEDLKKRVGYRLTDEGRAVLEAAKKGA